MMNNLKYKIHICCAVLFSVVLLTYSFVTYKKNPKFYSKTFLMAGTYITISSPEKRAIEIAHRSLKENEQMINLYDNKSELSIVNSTAYDKDVKLSDDLYQLLSLSQEAYRITDKVFDVSSGSLIALWKAKIKNNDSAFPSQDDVDQALSVSGFSSVRLNKLNKSIRFDSKGLILDLGGIAKGFMVDKAINALKDSGVKSALINAGGDVYCLGTKNGRPWKIGVNNPELEGIVETYPLVNQAIATSGSYEQFFEHEGEKYSHIINPFDGFPVKNKLVSVSVIAHNLTTADIFATTFFIIGPEETKKYLAKTYSNMRVFMIEMVDGEKKIHVLGDIF